MGKFDARCRRPVIPLESQDISTPHFIQEHRSFHDLKEYRAF